MSQKMLDTAADTFVNTGGSLESRNRTLQLRAVEADRDALVAQEVALEIPCFRRNGSEKLRSHIVRLHRYVECVGDARIDLRPR